MAHINNKYKLGDIVIYNGDRYRVTSVRRTTTSIPYTIWDYEYNLFLDRDPREGELSLIKGVNERLISRKVDEIYEDLKTPKYNVNDIVIIDKDFSYEYSDSVVRIIGIIKDVFNHRDTGEVFYHIIFNSGTPKKLFEYEIKAKFDTGKFKDGQSIHKQLLAKMYHTRGYKYLTEKEVLEWADSNFVRIQLKQSLHKVHDDMIDSLLYSVPTFYMAKEDMNAMFGVSKFEYKKIIFSGPCTIILWKDGTKTIAKASDGEIFDPEKGVAICFMKRALGETEGKKVLRKANKDYYDEELKKATFPLPIDTNKVIKVKEEKENNNLAIGSRCSTCKYYDRPMTADPCSYCISDDQYKKREETKMDFRSCSTCKYASKPVTDKPCSKCASKSRYEKGYEK